MWLSAPAWARILENQHIIGHVLGGSETDGPAAPMAAESNRLQVDRTGSVAAAVAAGMRKDKTGGIAALASELLTGVHLPAGEAGSAEARRPGWPTCISSPISIACARGAMSVFSGSIQPGFRRE